MKRKSQKPTLHYNINAYIMFTNNVISMFDKCYRLEEIGSLGSR